MRKTSLLVPPGSAMVYHQPSREAVTQRMPSWTGHRGDETLAGTTTATSRSK